MTELIQDGFALSKVADHVHVSAQIDCMTACSPFRLPVLTCRAASARQLYLHDVTSALAETHLIALQLVDAASCWACGIHICALTATRSGFHWPGLLALRLECRCCMQGSPDLDHNTCRSCCRSSSWSGTRTSQPMTHRSTQSSLSQTKKKSGKRTCKYCDQQST